MAGAVVALTPVATLMFRYNNPDALLTLVLTAAAYATIRALEGGRTRWMVLAGVLIGFGFITKMLQALILLPVLGLVYLLAGPPKLGRRLVQCVYLGVATLVAGGWWVAAVQLLPAGDRPYVGGSTEQQRAQPHLRLQRVRAASPATRPAASVGPGSPATCGARPAGTGCS